MVARKGKPYGGPWYSNYRELMAFERGTTEQFTSLKSANKRSGREIWREYSLTIDVPEYESRKVVIKLKPGSDNIPRVKADGPTSSPHRYDNSDGELCMWYPWDPKENRWVFADGLLHLLVLIQLHLFREAWWRETGGNNDGEWLGAEMPHDENIEHCD